MQGNKRQNSWGFKRPPPLITGTMIPLSLQFCSQSNNARKHSNVFYWRNTFPSHKFFLTLIGYIRYLAMDMVFALLSSMSLERTVSTMEPDMAHCTASTWQSSTEKVKMAYHLILKKSSCQHLNNTLRGNRSHTYSGWINPCCGVTERQCAGQYSSNFNNLTELFKIWKRPVFARSPITSDK